MLNENEYEIEMIENKCDWEWVYYNYPCYNNTLIGIRKIINSCFKDNYDFIGDIIEDDI